MLEGMLKMDYAEKKARKTTLLFLSCHAYRSSISENPWPLFFPTIILLEWESVSAWRQTERFFSPTVHKGWCKGHNVSVISPVINCLLKQHVCYVWEETASKTFTSWYFSASQWFSSILLTCGWSEIIFYMFSLCLFKDAPEQIIWSFFFEILQFLLETFLWWSSVAALV